MREAAELCLDEGLECPVGLGTEFDVENLLRMDSTTQMKVLADGVKGVILSPNEARRRVMPLTPGVFQTLNKSTLAPLRHRHPV